MKKRKRTSPQHLPARKQDVHKAKKQATDFAVTYVWAVMFTIMRDKFGWGEVSDTLANNQNLVPQAHKLTDEEASKGGIASGEARRRKRDLRQALEILLEREYKDKAGKSITGTEAITAKLFEQAMKGSIKAFETIRSTIGQDPVQKVMVAEVEQEVIDEVERAVLDNGEG